MALVPCDEEEVLRGRRGLLERLSIFHRLDPKEGAQEKLAVGKICVSTVRNERQRADRVEVSYSFVKMFIKSESNAVHNVVAGTINHFIMVKFDRFVFSRIVGGEQQRRHTGRFRLWLSHCNSSSCGSHCFGKFTGRRFLE